ncbi:hypothetical protein MYX65_11210 [Acidobacteria bacterium AH-259-L09]|nr:hypothetical protein [Acidobacteria bacterium AH-259-L09]
MAKVRERYIIDAKGNKTGVLLEFKDYKKILVYRPEEIAAWDEVPQAFVTTAMKQGRVIYEKEKG